MRLKWSKEENELTTLKEICHTIQIDENTIIEMVEYELITPKGGKPENWRFDANSLARAKRAVSFYQDLEVNYPGIALALDLLDTIEKLEKKIKTLDK